MKLKIFNMIGMTDPSASSDDHDPLLPRERFARTWAGALVVVFTAYFVAVAIQRADGDARFLDQISLLAAALGALAVVALLTTYLPRFRARAGDVLSDERDSTIEGEAAATAYKVLIAGVIVVGCVLPFSRSGWDIVNPALAAIGLAEFVHHALVARAYRRG